jgi:hypothetical protein
LMGNLLSLKTSSTNVLILGLKSAGKTHFLYNGLLEEGWQDAYRMGPEKDDAPDSQKKKEFGNQKR